MPVLQANTCSKSACRSRQRVDQIASATQAMPAGHKHLESAARLRALSALAALGAASWKRWNSSLAPACWVSALLRGSGRNSYKAVYSCLQLLLHLSALVLPWPSAWLAACPD